MRFIFAHVVDVVEIQVVPVGGLVLDVASSSRSSRCSSSR